METKEIKRIDIEQCARCGLDHTGLAFKKFKNPIVDSDGTVWNWWSLCLRTGEPILMKIKEVDD